MFKKAIYGTMAVATVSGLIFGRDAISYVRTGYTSAREAIRGEVPVGFEIERARQEVQLLIPEIGRSVRVVAEEQVAIENLKKIIADKAEAAATQEEALLTLSSELKTEKTQFVFAGSNYSKNELERDLAERFNRFKVVEDTLKREREMLAAKEQALKSHRETLESMISQKKTLEVELDRLAARVSTLEARKTVVTLDIDDSKLAQVKMLIAEIDQKLDVEDAVLNAEGNFAGLIPVEKTQAYIEEDVAAKVQEYLSDKSDKSQVAVK